MKKVISVLIAVVFMFMLSAETFAMSVNIFIAENGSEIEYYLDENGMPYQNIDGERVYVALSLPSLEIKDENLINELNSQLPSKEASDMSRSVPTDYIDLSNCANDSNSIEYSINATGLDEDFFNTKPFKYNTSHKAIAIKSSNHKKPLLGGDKHINITYFYYSSQKDKWYSITMMDKDCSVSGGFRFQHSPSLYPYGKFSLIAHNTLKSCTIKIFTTPYATGGTIPQI
ncbi:MAG: hypothetical protein K2G60_01485 [Oscillospiraceae bacterium]|nr:hypothetical protein [Oscillospiraceae bacterium]